MSGLPFVTFWFDVHVCACSPPLAGNSDNSNSKSVDASNLTYDAELPPKAEPNVGVRCIDVSPDGRWLASGDRQGRIRVHDLQNMSEYSNMKSHDAEVLSISFCPKPPPKGLDGSGKIQYMVHGIDLLMCMVALPTTTSVVLCEQVTTVLFSSGEAVTVRVEL